MKFFKAFTFILFLIKIGFTQTPCLPTFGGIPAGNEAPGCFLCGPIYQGSTQGYTPTAPFSDGFPCGNVENNQFISIMADSTGSMVGTVLASNCQNGQGVQLIIYDQMFVPVSNCFSSGGTNLPGNVTASGLTPGVQYWIMIDGFAGDICDMLITTSGGIPQIPPDPPGVMTASKDTSLVCIGDIICYAIDSIPKTIQYEWLIPTSAKVLSGGGPSDLEVCVQYIRSGNGELQVIPRDRCFFGVPIFKVISIPEFSIDTVTCPGEIIAFGGRLFDSTVQIEFVSLNPNNNELCDSSYFNLKILQSDTSPPDVTYLQDTFLNGIALNWPPSIGAIEYEIYANGNFITVQDHTSFFYQFLPNQDSVTIKILPINLRNCNFIPAEITCVLPKTSSLVEKSIENSITIFPNPTKNQVIIQSPFLIKKVEVFDFSGKKILTSNKSTINLFEHPAGIYFLKIKTEKGIIFKKTIKS